MEHGQSRPSRRRRERERERERESHLCFRPTILVFIPARIGVSILLLDLVWPAAARLRATLRSQSCPIISPRQLSLQQPHHLRRLHPHHPLRQSSSTHGRILQPRLPPTTASEFARECRATPRIARSLILVPPMRHGCVREGCGRIVSEADLRRALVTRLTGQRRGTAPASTVSRSGAHTICNGPARVCQNQRS